MLQASARCQLSVDYTHWPSTFVNPSPVVPCGTDIAGGGTINAKVVDNAPSGSLAMPAAERAIRRVRVHSLLEGPARPGGHYRTCKAIYNEPREGPCIADNCRDSARLRLCNCQAE